MNSQDVQNQPTRTKKLGKSEFEIYCKSQPQTSHLIFSIQKHLKTSPSFYYNSLLIFNRGRHIQTIHKNLKAELYKLNQSKSFYHIIKRALISREKCIQKIKRQLSKAQKVLGMFKKKYLNHNNHIHSAYVQYVEHQGYSTVQIDETIQNSINLIKTIFIDMSRLRDITIYIVDSVYHWKVELQEWSDRCNQHQPISFIHQEQNVYDMILQDTQFIWKSALCEYIFFETTVDPFMIRNVIQVEIRSQKTVLEKYFVQILYPNSQEIVKKCVQCYQMLTFKYQIQKNHLHREEELLVENYLSLKKRQQQEEGIDVIQQNVLEWKDKLKNEKKNQSNSKFSIFGKILNKPANQKVTDMFSRHQYKITLINPFNISNYHQKNLAHLSQFQHGKEQKTLQIRNQGIFKNYRVKSTQQMKRINSQQKIKVTPVKNEKNNYKQNKNDSTNRMYQSLSKLSPVIIEDSSEHYQQVPQGNLNVERKFTENNKLIESKKTIQESPEILKDVNSKEEQPTQRSQSSKKSQELQNSKQDGNVKTSKLQSNQKKLSIIRQLLKTHHLHSKITLNLNKQKYSIQKQFSKTKTKTSRSPIKDRRDINLRQSDERKNKFKNQNSFSQQNKLSSHQPNFQNHKQPFKFLDDSISLLSKRIPADIVPAYLRHLFTQVHSTSKKFTLYSYDEILKKLQDPFTQCIIFDVNTSKKGRIGQVILSQSLQMSNNSLKYTIQFINIHIFELFVATVLKVAQDLLYTTPSDKVICSFYEDKLDPVSVHFMQLIESAFKSKTPTFGRLKTFQKKSVQYMQSQLQQKVFIFSSKGRKAQLSKICEIMMSNYRSVKFQCKCLMLSSNFRMRYRSQQKNTIVKYDTQSVGYLYKKLLQRIITKHHLKQMKISSSSILTQSSFIRTSIKVLLEFLKQLNKKEDDFVYLNKFTNMFEVLKYIDYKGYSEYFQFEFLEQSRFILNHELYLTELQLQLSLEFMVRPSLDFLILHNYRNLKIKMVESNQQSKAKAVILPTLNSEIQLILIDGKQYENQTTEELDMFTYLYIYQQNILKNWKEVSHVRDLVIPMIHKSTNNFNNLKKFDGFFRLFPQRQFYSASYFKCTNFWENYFPSAVVYQPQPQNIIFEYPLIVGYVHKPRKQILTAFLLNND